jgi:hypothetical protein
MHVRFLALTTELLNTLKKTEDSLQRLKRTKRKPDAQGSGGDAIAAAAAAGVGTDGGAMTDEAKIRQQLWLDVRQYIEEVRTPRTYPDRRRERGACCRSTDNASAFTVRPT